MPAADWTPSNGTTFTWDGNTYKCLDISFEKSSPERERVDMTTLDVEPGEEAVMVYSPILPKRDPYKFSITYRSLGNTVEIDEGVESTLTTTDGSGTYRCVKAGLSRKAKEYVEGTAEFVEVIADELVDFGS